MITKERAEHCGHYKLLIKDVYYFVHHTPIRASSLTQFEVSTQPRGINFSIANIPSPEIKFGCIVVDEDLIKNGVQNMNTVSPLAHDCKVAHKFRDSNIMLDMGHISFHWSLLHTLNTMSLYLVSGLTFGLHPE